MKAFGQLATSGLAFQQSFLGQPVCDLEWITSQYSFRRQVESSLTNDTFKWETITPRPHLEFHPCLKEFKCARLEVPLDWKRADGNGSKIAIAILMQPAKVPVTDKRYGGPILLNPGGPGGSGTGFLLRAGDIINQIVDSPESPAVAQSDAKYFDLIGFDPRGIGLTTPSSSCFEHSLARQAWGIEEQAIGLPGTTPTSLSQHWARAKAYGKGCTSRNLDGEGEHHAQFVGTANVARDMIEIAERHAEWREKEAGKLANQAGCKLNAETVERTTWQKGKELLQYWGFSYGTVLGATTAAIFPDRVKRVILDGVVDMADYYTTSWSKNLDNADEVFDSFFQYCDQAGPKGCKVWTEGGAKAIRAVFDALLDIVRNDPLEIRSAEGPGLITIDDFEQGIWRALYKPIQYFPQLADIFYDVSKGNVSSFEKLKNEQRIPYCPLSPCKSGLVPSPECGGAWDELDAGRLVYCSDGESTANWTKASFEEHWLDQRNLSKTIGNAWSTIPLACVGTNIKSKWRHADIQANTSHPILFIGNTLDPVTPLKNAFHVSESFPGSSVLHQKSGGHCTISSPSVCSAKIIRKYFHTGELPKKGTECEVDALPLVGTLPTVKTMSSEDFRLFEALKKASESVHITKNLPLGI